MKFARALVVAAVASLACAPPALGDQGSDAYRMPGVTVAPDVGSRAVVQRTAVLTEANRASNIPPSSTPYLRLVGAEFRLDLADQEFYVEATLAGEPPGPISQAPTAVWYVGTVAGNTCQQVGAEVSDWFPGVMVNEADDLPPGWESANCAVITLLNSDDAVVDVLIGLLADELPTLQLGAPELLGKSKLKLVRGVWTRLDVEVRNDGPGIASGVVVSGKGKGLKVRKGTVDFDIARDGTGSTEIEVKLVGKQKKTKLKLTAATEEVKTTRTAKVRRTAPPKPPAPGSYKSKDGAVHFTVTKGSPKVSGFRVFTQTTCGGFGTIPTYTMNTYDFRKVKIPRNGIVDARQSVDGLYSAALVLRFVGGKVKYGRFFYSASGPCQATESFTAKRTGN